MNPEHVNDLRKSGLTDEAILEAGIETISLREVSRRLLFAPRYLESAYWIPYPGEDFGRVRGFYRKDKPGRKYLQAKGSAVRIYIPPRSTEALSDAKTPLYITEGEKKALKASQEGLCCIGLGGLWNWKRDKRLLPDFDKVSLDNRDVFIIPDNDFRRRQNLYGNRDLLSAVEGLSRALTERKARVKIILLPRDTEKIGLDDYLIANSVESLRQLKCVEAAEIRSMPWTENVMEMLNDLHAVVMIGGKCCVLNETVNPVFNRPDITFSRPSDFISFHSNLKIEVPDKKTGGTKQVEAARIWMGSRERRTYAGVIFSPQRDEPGFFNLWRGFAVEPIPGDWSLLQRHIIRDICRGDPQHFNYLMAWCADAVQNPGGQRPGVAVVLRGGKGTGKGLFATSMGRIFGSHFLHLSSNHHLTGRFNSHLKNALWVFADEAFWAGDKASEGVLKQMITEDQFNVEAKGQDVYTVKNHVRVIVSSNEAWVVPATLEERRFFVLDVSKDHARDTKYFAPIWAQMNAGGIEAMFYDLLEWDCSGVDLRTAPKTEALFEQSIQGMTTVQKWWYERLRSGSQLADDTEWRAAVTTGKLHDDYVRFAAVHGDRFPVVDSLFARELRKLQPGICRKRMSGEGMRGREWYLIFPYLDVCRARFEEIAECSCRWNEDEVGPECPSGEKCGTV